MKNASLILNIVLLIAVGVLYYLHFKKQEPESPGVISAVKLPEPVSSAIVYVNSDSLLDKYMFIRKKKEELEARHKRIEGELESEGSRLEKDVEDYRQKGGAMTNEQRQQTEEQLMIRQQQLMQKEKTLTSKLDDEQQQISEELYKRLNSYLKEYNKDKNYHYILGYQKGGGILFANDSLNITPWIIEGLNKKFAEESQPK